MISDQSLLLSTIVLNDREAGRKFNVDETHACLNYILKLNLSL